MGCVVAGGCGVGTKTYIDFGSDFTWGCLALGCRARSRYCVECGRYVVYIGVHIVLHQ